MSLHNSSEEKRNQKWIFYKLVSAAEQHKQSNFNPAKRLKFEEEEQQSDMKFSTEA